jgi:chromosome segregation ATPase
MPFANLSDDQMNTEPKIVQISDEVILGLMERIVATETYDRSLYETICRLGTELEKQEKHVAALEAIGEKRTATIVTEIAKQGERLTTLEETDSSLEKHFKYVDLVKRIAAVESTSINNDAVWLAIERLKERLVELEELVSDLRNYRPQHTAELEDHNERITTLEEHSATLEKRTAFLEKRVATLEANQESRSWLLEDFTKRINGLRERADRHIEDSNERITALELNVKIISERLLDKS